MMRRYRISLFFFFNDTATTEIYTLSLHDALPILVDKIVVGADRILRTGHVTNKIGTLPIALSAKFYEVPFYVAAPVSTIDMATDRKSTRLNSSHSQISYAVFCLKKKNHIQPPKAA